MRTKIVSILFLAFLMPLKSLAVAEGVTIKNYVYAEKDGEVLTLDVYNDPSDHRYGKKPVFIFSFGGGWEGGNRMEGHALLTDMAEAGYLAIGIDYRLYIRKLKHAGMQFKASDFGPSYAQAVMMGVEDLLDATAFVLKNADAWGIDSTKVVICGCSAGATDSFTAEYLICSEHPLAKEKLPEGFNYAAVVPFAGGIWMADTPRLEWKKRPCPFLFFHGTSDQLVPFSFDSIDNGHFSAYGPESVIPDLEAAQVPYYLHAYVGNDHGVAMFYNKRQVREELKTYLIKLLWLGEKLKMRVNEERYDRPHVQRTLQDTINGLIYRR